MRDKTMNIPSQPRDWHTATQARCAAGSKTRRPLSHLAIAVLLMQLTLPVPAFYAREQTQIQPQGASPDVQITQVKALPVLKDVATTEVEIRWTAQVPRLTTLDEFEVLLEVRYSDGSRAVARNQQLKATARAILLSLATHPRPNSTAVLKDFKASVNVRFRIASSFAVVQQVAAQDNARRALSGSSNGSQPDVFITTARLSPQGCSAGQQCVDVKWTAAATRNIAISEFTATVETRLKDGTQITDSKTVSAQDRQVRLQAGPANVEVNSMKVRVLTSFSLLDSKTVVKDGIFLIHSLNLDPLRLNPKFEPRSATTDEAIFANQNTALKGFLISMGARHQGCL